MDEVDRIVREGELYTSRQQFIESAIRERIEKSKLAEEKGDDFSVHVKDTFLAQAICCRMSRGAIMSVMSIART